MISGHTGHTRGGVFLEKKWRWDDDGIQMFQDHWWVILPKSSYKSAWNLAGPPQWILGTNHRNPCSWKQDESWSKAIIAERMIFAQKAKDLITESFTLCFCCSECILSFTYSCQSCHAIRRCQDQALILGSNKGCITLLWEPSTYCLFFHSLEHWVSCELGQTPFPCLEKLWQDPFSVTTHPRSQPSCKTLEKHSCDWKVDIDMTPRHCESSLLSQATTSSRPSVLHDEL